MHPKANLLSSPSQKHPIHSKSYWFTEACKFTTLTAVRCALHGHPSRDIRCWKCCSVCCCHHINSSTQLASNAAVIWTCKKKSCCLKLQSRSKSRMPVQSIHMHVTYNTEKVHEWSLPCHLQYQKNTRMIFPQVHLRKHLREFSFLWVIRFTRLSTAMSAPEHSGSDPLKVSPWVL